MTPLPDDHPDKWEMKGQTEVKHEIFRKYLEPWLYKISEVPREVRYLDGFAGRGYYEDESKGSPVLALEVANENADVVSPKLSNFRCFFVEADSSNFANLEARLEEMDGSLASYIEYHCVNEEFNDFAMEYIEENKKRTPPAFIFIDPFGFGDVSFETVADLVNLRSTGVEVFITFMSGKMAQYMEVEEHSKGINNILGTDRWQDEVDPSLSKNERASEFVRIYEEQLREEAGVEYVWPFRMSEETKRQNCYYLVHATNHFQGFELMKRVMFNEGAADSFAYLGPDHYPYMDDQSSLSQFGVVEQDEIDIAAFAENLFERYKNEQTTLKDIMKATYEETTLVKTHYREALMILKNEGRLEVEHRPDRPDGNEERGIGLDDDLKFHYGGLGYFT